MKNRDVMCVDNSSAKGEYHTLSLQVWTPIKTISTNQGVIRVPEECLNRELRILANIISVETEDDSVFSDEEHKLNKGHWRDIRKTKAEKLGKPFILKDTLFIKMPDICKNNKLLLYVENIEVVNDDINKESTN